MSVGVEEAVESSRDAGRTAVVVADDVWREYADNVALAGVSFDVRAGEIHALLGPNGAGKTTLLRLLTGLLAPTAGTVSMPGLTAEVTDRAARRHIGFVPSGDRTFYNRISGFENLLFYGRLYGFSKADAARRADARLEHVGLAHAARRPVGQYSHGMQKRLSVARALLMDPSVLFVDEATHDLDPQGARDIRELVAGAAAGGTAVIWTTQRVDEIRGFADRVTVLAAGRVRFRGTVPQLMAIAEPRRFVVRLVGNVDDLVAPANAAVEGLATVLASGEDDREHAVVVLRDGVVLGDAIARLAGAGIGVAACREERSEVETALLRLTNDEVDG